MSAGRETDEGAESAPEPPVTRSGSPGPKLSNPRRARWLRSLARAGIVVVVFATIARGALEVAIRARPFTAEELSHEGNDSLRIRDRNGVLLREVVNGSGERAEWVPLARISPEVIEATLAVEDDRFSAHDGVDKAAVLRAALQNLRGGRIVSGASTLTMQLARRLRPHRRDLLGKVGEMIDAWRLERALTKDELLEQYLNRAPYGAGAVGIEAASQRYFGKPSSHLSLAEAAQLAGLPKAPSGLNPFRNPEGAKARARVVLARLEQTQRASQDDVEQARREPVSFVSAARPSAMHFTDWVYALALQQRASTAGSGARTGDVETSLDSTLQHEVEELVSAHVRSLGAEGVGNAAVVVLDNDTCDVLAMVGSADYWDARDGSVNGALARRQPGSTLKPFTYALAFEKGFSPATTVADVETRYGEPGGDLFVPQNFSKDFSGPVLMGDALGRSLNVPAIRVAGLVGADVLLERLHALGFASLDQSAEHYGLGLTLGNGEVTLLELSQAYAALARGGLACKASPLQPEPERGRVFSADVSALVTHVLSDETLRIRAFGPNNALMLGFPVAVKTGTSTNFRDNWAVGYTPRYTVAVWAGNFDGTPLEQLAGASGAGPLFNKVMTRVALRNGQPRPEALPVDGDLVEVTVCATSGKRPGPHCPERRRVVVRKDEAPKEDCPHHRLVRVDLRNGLLAGDKCPARFVRERAFELLPSTYAEWQSTHAAHAPPSRYSPLCPEKGRVPDAVVVTWPRKNDVFVIEPGYDRKTQSVELAADVDPPVASVHWRIDGTEVAQAEWPYKARWPLEPGRHVVEAIAGAKRSDAVEIEVR